jgi:hypothetical protein
MGNIWGSNSKSTFICSSKVLYYLYLQARICFLTWEWRNWQYPLGNCCDVDVNFLFRQFGIRESHFASDGQNCNFLRVMCRSV